MSYNLNTGIRNTQGIGRKIKRVSDVNAMGPAAPLPSQTPYMQPTPDAHLYNPNLYGNAAAQQANNVSGFNGGLDQMSMPQSQPLHPQQQSQQPTQNYGYAIPTTQPIAVPNTPPMYGPTSSGAAPQMPYNTGMPNNVSGQQFAPQFGMFPQPIVQDMAMQYGQKLADQGKQLVENQFQKWVPVSKLKYYFAVDNAYVGRKLRLLFFPFLQKEWSLKYDQEHPVQPRYDINAPDLYLPTMGYITYVVVAGLLLGMQNRFSPEQLGIQASSALAYSIFELVVYSITLYVMNIKTSLKTLDLVAFTGYKFVNIVACLLISVLCFRMGYYCMLAYTTLSFGFFLLRTLRTKVLFESTPNTHTGPINYDPYGNPQQYDYSGGRKRKLYFLFLIVGGQALFSFLLSKHLYVAVPLASSATNNLDTPLN